MCYNTAAVRLALTLTFCAHADRECCYTPFKRLAWVKSGTFETRLFVANLSFLGLWFLHGVETVQVSPRRKLYSAVQRLTVLLMYH
ncbi:hypothetical protein BKA83DRAFT_1713200 [Pisolithus microcarpus]|nr:hypothetical protein BKA83DRAFT_1713200 [Pisolithus microcarpus]